MLHWVGRQEKHMYVLYGAGRCCMVLYGAVGYCTEYVLCTGGAVRSTRDTRDHCSLPGPLRMHGIARLRVIRVI